MDFTVTVLSNADPGSSSKNNTLSNFTNYINPGLVLGSEPWEVALIYFYCHNQFVNNQNDFLEVSCDLILPQNQQSRTIAYIARPKEYNGIVKPVYYEPAVKEYFPVATTYISSINIQLWTTKEKSNVSYENDLLAGQATVVGLHFRPTNMFSIDHVLRIESDAKKNYMFPNNTCQQFTVELGPEFNFDPNAYNLEVALSSITYKTRFEFDTLEILQFDEKQPDKQVFAFKAPAFTGSTLTQYINYIENDVLKPLKEKSPKPVEIEISFAKSRSNNNKRLYLVAKTTCIIQFPYSMMLNLGERSFTPIKGISFSDAKTAYSYKLKIGPNNTYTFAAPASPFAFFPDLGFIHCDFIQNNIFGNSDAPILKTFPIQQKDIDTDYVTFSVAHPEFYPVCKYDLSFVHFILKDIVGNPLPFLDKNANTVLTLFIRNKNKYMTI